MKQNFKKKAFTLVELLVVIAIIAVLASVSVVGYMHFIDKAHVSNDITLVKQLNTILSSSEVTEGKNNTLYDAILDLEESGLEEKDLKSSASDRYDLLWDQTNDRFAMFDTKKQEFTATDANNLPSLENKYLLWKMYDKLAEVEDYSIYLKKDATFEPSVLTNLSVGFDAGKNETSYDVTYVGVNTGVKFRTLNGNIIINNELADVEVYGNQTLLSVLNASNNSVHVFGNVEKVRLSKGHLDIKKIASVKILTIETEILDDNTFISIHDLAKNKLQKIEVYQQSIYDTLKSQIGEIDILPSIIMNKNLKLAFVKNNDYVEPYILSNQEGFTYKYKFSFDYFVRYENKYRQAGESSVMNVKTVSKLDGNTFIPTHINSIQNMGNYGFINNVTFNFAAPKVPMQFNFLFNDGGVNVLFEMIPFSVVKNTKVYYSFTIEGFYQGNSMGNTVLNFEGIIM